MNEHQINAMSHIFELEKSVAAGELSIHDLVQWQAGLTTLEALGSK